MMKYCCILTLFRIPLFFSRKIGVGFFFLLVCFLAGGQTYNFSRLDNTDGLSNNQVNCIFKDHTGFMWFGTNYGLNRYDGYQFKVFKYVRDDSTSMPFNTITAIQEDSDSRLWIKGNTDYAGYTVYDSRKGHFVRNITAFVSQMGLPAEPGIVEIDQRKNLYFYCRDEGIYRYDVRANKLEHFPQNISANTFSNGTVVSLKVSGNHIWALFRSGLLERYNINTGTIDFRNDYLVKLGKTSTLTKKLFIDSDGEPWVFPGYADKGVLYLNMSQLKWTPIDHKYHANVYPTSGWVRDVVQEPSGKLWIAYDHGGIDVLDKSTGKILNLKYDPDDPRSLSQNSAISLHCDDTGIMWAGTYKNGVCYYHPNQFKFEQSPLFYYHNEHLQVKDCNSLYEDSKGILWIGTNGEGLLRYDPGMRDFTLYRNNTTNPESISSDVVISILEDSKGDIWFGTFLGGVNRLKDERFVHYLPEEGNPFAIPNKNIYKMIEDRHRNIWLATLGGGMARLNPARDTFQTFNTLNTPSLVSDYILSLYPANETQIYLCTAYGLSLLDTETGAVTRCFEKEGLTESLSDQVLYNVCTDRDGNLWIATDNGVNIFHPKEMKFTYLNQANGLPSEQAVSLLQDGQGAMWVGTRNGLARVTMEKDGEQYRFSIVSFDENDGLASPICNHNAMFMSPNGLIYVGTTKGYTVFDPRTIAFNTVPPSPRFTELLIDNEVIGPGQEYQKRVILQQSVTEINELKLPYRRKNFTIQFSSLNYLHPNKNHYCYMLKGYDDKWHETTGGTGAAAYANLSPGTYELLVKASNNDLVWNEGMLAMKIVILPPFWMSWLAYLIYIVFVMIALWAIVQYYLNKQKKRFEMQQKMLEANRTHELDEMKLRFFTNISHEFRTPLTLIINPVEKMLDDERSEAERSLLSIIHNNARALLDLVNQILDFRKLDVGKTAVNLSNGDIIAFIRDICYSFSDLANKKFINYSFVTTVTELYSEFDKEKIRKIISNLLSNAFKFTPEGGKIEINISISVITGGEKRLVVHVSDTGPGIAEEYHDKIFERFFQLEHATSNQSGTGVGLHLSREYARLLKGDLTVKSSSGKGSIFTFEVPIKLEVHEEVIAQSQQSQPINTGVVAHAIVDEPEETSSQNPELPLLLIVDDNEDFREFMSRLLEDSFRIITASDGEIARQNVLKSLPDLVISDVMMPNKDGLEFCREIKADIRTSHIPVILLTAKSSEENQYSGIEAGADDYIAKPFNMSMLKLKVSHLVERQKKMQERFRKKIGIALPEMEVTSMDEKFVQKAVQIVEKNLSNSEFRVEDLVSEMAMSRVYFYKKILALTAKTPSEFIRFIRLKRAAELLEKSQMFVNEIAYQVGFNDVKYFRKYFKDEFGVAPNEYKKKDEGK